MASVGLGQVEQVVSSRACKAPARLWRFVSSPAHHIVTKARNFPTSKLNHVALTIVSFIQRGGQNAQHHGWENMARPRRRKIVNTWTLLPDIEDAPNPPRDLEREQKAYLEIFFSPEQNAAFKRRFTEESRCQQDTP